MSDEERFDRLYRTHRAVLERFVHRRLPPAQVEDVVAETFLVAWRRLDEVPENPAPWLFGTARNLMLRSVRSSGRRMALQVRLASEPPAVTGDLDSSVATRTDLVRAWSKLTAGEQEVLTLIAWDGLSVGEAAAVVGCRAGTFRTRLMRARRHLLHVLDRLPAVEASPAHPVTGGVTP